MKTKSEYKNIVLTLLMIASIFYLSACSPKEGQAHTSDLTTPEEVQTHTSDLTTPEEVQAEVSYNQFSLPDPEGISFELPQGWAFWGNAVYLSPDDGKTFAGIRFSWIQEGKDAEALLYNEGATIHEKSTEVVAGLETHRYIVETTLTSAATGKIIFHAYEMIYAFPAPNGEMMTGVVISTQTIDELQPLVPVAEHMITSLTWDRQN